MQRDDDSANDHNDEKKNDQQAHPKAKLLANHRKNEIGVRVGQVEHLLAAIAETESFHSAAAPGDQRLHLLQAGVFLVALEICKRDQPLHPCVGGADKNYAASKDRQEAKQ